MNYPCVMSTLISGQIGSETYNVDIFHSFSLNISCVIHDEEDDEDDDNDDEEK